MKQFLITTVFLLFSFTTLLAQDDGIFDPVKWKVSLDKQSDTEYNVLLQATIDEGWHLYSQTQFGEEFEGPIRTEITYNNTPETYTLVGETQEPDVPVLFDPVFEIDVKCALHIVQDIGDSNGYDIIESGSLNIKFQNRKTGHNITGIQLPSIIEGRLDNPLPFYFRNWFEICFTRHSSCCSCID